MQHVGKGCGLHPQCNVGGAVTERVKVGELSDLIQMFKTAQNGLKEAIVKAGRLIKKAVH